MWKSGLKLTYGSDSDRDFFGRQKLVEGKVVDAFHIAKIRNPEFGLTRLVPIPAFHADDRLVQGLA